MVLWNEFEPLFVRVHVAKHSKNLIVNILWINFLPLYDARHTVAMVKVISWCTKILIFLAFSFSFFQISLSSAQQYITHQLIMDEFWQHIKKNCTLKNNNVNLVMINFVLRISCTEAHWAFFFILQLPSTCNVMLMPVEILILLKRLVHAFKLCSKNINIVA